MSEQETPINLKSLQELKPNKFELNRDIPDLLVDFQLSRHAQRQLAKRGIPFHLVQLVLEEPQQILEEGEVKIYQSQVDYNDKMQLLRVFVPVIVVSVYNTSKINKYWR